VILASLEHADRKVILDPYAGSCTVAVACSRIGRRSISIEIEERYFRIGIERMEREAARHPLLEPKLRQQTLL
jgi:DNA modification methylase